jgi:hypothetical protein
VRKFSEVTPQMRMVHMLHIRLHNETKDVRFEKGNQSMANAATRGEIRGVGSHQHQLRVQIYWIGKRKAERQRE